MTNQSIRNTAKLISLSAITVALSACGSSSSNNDSNELAATANLPSMIIGQVTGVTSDSITVNDHTIAASSAEIEIDGNNATLANIKQGMIVEVETNGTSATEIEYDPVFKGPINIQNDQVSIAGVTLSNLNSSDFSQGQLFEISGYSHSLNSLTVTYQAPITNSQSELEVQGSITNLNQQLRTFNLGDLVINYQQADIDGTLSNGQLVEVEGFYNNAIFTATEVDAEQSLSFTDNIDTELEGVITFVNNNMSLITLNSQWQVSINDQTQFEDGTTANLVVGQVVEVDGVWQQANNKLLAQEIEFESTNINSNTTNQQFSVAGVVSYEQNIATINGIEFTFNSQTVFEDGLSVNNLDGQWVELEGTYNNEQNSVSEVELEDDTSEINLTGLVSANQNQQATLWGYISEDNSLTQYLNQTVELECQWVASNQVRACVLDD
ncbi:MAG TPA: hypothetical protein ENH67_00555 [Pseudoalteromonas sp.]|uniref:DUF5666 domain-containing protein n=1 Tax=marine sediment metagenome TaxID=412755 RepID=A0A0F9U605_9ZZZZ|nr:DUF5666 domain-containing protein [Pseudoalteromonas sp.]HDY92301.1 hypothetical protein [Pseudoalteromonas sp.]HDZ31371.1 hypothetical protein [Pseudoalteromonas sp.]